MLVLISGSYFGKNTVVNENSASSEQRFVEFLPALAPVVSSLLGNLLGSDSIIRMKSEFMLFFDVYL